LPNCRNDGFGGPHKRLLLVWVLNARAIIYAFDQGGKK
jgi:hypothetical protein